MAKYVLDKKVLATDTSVAVTSMLQFDQKVSTVYTSTAGTSIPAL